jgi:rubrerythrin
MDASRAAANAMSHNLRQLREEQGLDQTLQNLLRALTLNLELRARYRVFEFEAAQDGHAEVADLFRELRELENGQITTLLAGLRERLDGIDVESLT